MNYDELLAPAAKSMRPSGIRKFFDLAAEMPHCISLGVGEPDFKTPWTIRDAGIRSLEQGRTRYTANAGIKELRAEICCYLARRMELNYQPSEVLVTVGGSEEKADEYVARPGASEHQLGMAMDVGQRNSSAGLTSSFADTKGGAWIAENCWRFGFILRYQEGWEDITGYSYEPWHVRYVGLEHAQAMHEANVPMETYMEDLREQVMIDLLVLE